MQHARGKKLVDVSLGYSDNGKGIIYVSGYAYNPGTTTYGCNVQILPQCFSEMTLRNPISAHTFQAEPLSTWMQT